MDKQREAISLIRSGHNLVLTGQGGSGKTYTIATCVSILRDDGNKVSLCCYTGIACLQYRGLFATTLHRFSGLGDGRFSAQTLASLVDNDQRYERTKQNIIDTDVLIIDEVSMVSKLILNKVEFICRTVRKNESYFGGLQVILVGDFFQLPPVKDELYGDFGHHCFKCTFFNDCFPHAITLTHIYRQTEQELTKAVNELERGKPSHDTNVFLQSLSRPLEHGDSVKLFSRNIDVDVFNYSKINTIPGQLYVFESEDTGDVHYLNKFTTPKRLGIKVSAPVMLLKNIDNTLVNGLIGNVVKINTESIDVSFIVHNKSVTANIKKCSFSKYDPVSNICLAHRVQFPLKLAFCMTIHKSQGMTLPFVEVDCRHAAQPGQIGVAVGRASSSAGLRIVNYKPSLCRQHPHEVYNFMNSLAKGCVYPDLSCCRKQITPQYICLEDETRPQEEHLSDSDFSDLEFNERILHHMEGMNHVEHNGGPRSVIFPPGGAVLNLVLHSGYSVLHCSCSHAKLSTTTADFL